MKVKKLAILILMITIIMILNIKVEATTGKINSETVRLRKEPNTSSTILEQLDKDAEVEILEQEDSWYKVKVKSNGETITGYVSEKLVDVKDEANVDNSETVTTKQPDTTVENTEETPVEPEPEVAEPLTETVDTTSTGVKENEQYTLEKETIVKAIPLINSKTKATINGNVKVIEIINDWCRVENDAEIGWIRVNALTKTTINEEQIQEPEQPIDDNQEQQDNEDKNTDKSEEKTTEKTSEKTQTTVTSINKTGYVSADGLKVRKEPSTSSEEIDSLSKNDKVSIIGEVDGWYQINLNGEKGYISSKYISDTKITEVTSRSGSSIKAENITPMEETTPEVEQNDNKTTSTSENKGNDVVEYAKQYLGCKYVSGGISPTTGFDCSGFTLYVYKHFGISLNRTSREQINSGISIEKSNLQPGDIVFFNNAGNTSIGHVGIYVGGDNFIHASNPKEGVRITSLSTSYYKKRYVGARRVF